MTEDRDEQHVQRMADALREGLDDNQDPEALAQLTGAALGDEDAGGELDAPEGEPAGS